MRERLFELKSGLLVQYSSNKSPPYGGTVREKGKAKGRER